MKYDSLKLENQLCFPVYAASRLITRAYQPHLEKLSLTYPQYLVLMLLWEQEGLTVNEIAGKLILNTNTVTPLLKRMEQQGLLLREKSKEDERKVIIRLSPEGFALREEALAVPESLIREIGKTSFTMDELMQLKGELDRLVDALR
ncbi:MAG: MarR family transcriptional regulator [Spirochaetales bacterium]|nr:MarR family transcriptional regulator [Spirochaetales bacterium]